MPLHKKARTLLEICSDSVCSVLVRVVVADRRDQVDQDCRDHVDQGVEMVELLSRLGLLAGMVEEVMDRIQSLQCEERIWINAAHLLLRPKTKQMRIKPGWTHGQVLVSRVPSLHWLTHVEVTGAGTDSLLLALSLGCPGLISLLTSYSSEISDIGLSALTGRHRDADYSGSDVTVGDTAGCRYLTVIQIISCPAISIPGVLSLLLHLPSLAYLAFEKLDRVFRSPALFQANRIYQVQNFEQTVSHQDTADESVSTRQQYWGALAECCPRLKTAKVNLTPDSDGYIKNLTSLTQLEEVILDFPGSPGPGFRYFFLHCGNNLTQLGLTLREVSAGDVHHLSVHCPALRVLHLFFLIFRESDSSGLDPRMKMFPNLEGLYLGVGRSSSLSLVHSLLTDRLLSHCIKLKTLYLSGVSPRLDDSYILQKLQQGSLSQLENCHIKEEARLGKETYLTLSKYCPALKRLNVSSWNISREEFLRMEERAKNENWDLILIGGK